MASETVMVRTELLDVAVDLWGPADGVPILLLHGFPYDPRSFDCAAEKLAQRNMRCIVPYLRGFGPTRFRSGETMRSGQQTALADDARQLLDALGLHNVLLAGFDWGGRAACICAALWPERVRGLLVVGGYLIQDLSDPLTPISAEIEHLIWHQYFLSSGRGRRALSERPEDICLHLRRQWSPGLVDEQLFSETAKSFDNPDFAEIVWHSYAHRIGAAPGDPRYATLDAALLPPPPVSTPAIVLSGGDAALGNGPGAHFSALVEHRIVGGAGHDPAAERPDAFADAILTLNAAVP